MQELKEKLLVKSRWKLASTSIFPADIESLRKTAVARYMKSETMKAKQSYHSYMRKKSPYNIYDSDIINDEFEYNQLLIFELDKEDAAMNSYREIIRFLKHLSQEIKSRILVTSDAHDEICLLDGRNILWSANWKSQGR